MFIKKHLICYGYAPSLSEIAKGVGISPASKSLISRYVGMLIKLKLLARKPKGYRNICFPIVVQSKLLNVEKIEVSSSTQCKQQLMCDVTELLYKKDHDLLVVKGSSMVQEGIFDGDKIIFKRQTIADDGDIVIVLIDKEKITIKRIHYQPNNIILLASANARFKPQAYPADRIIIQGVFIGMLRLSL